MLDRQFFLSSAAKDKAFVVGLLNLEIRDSRAQLYAARRAYHTERTSHFEKRLAELKAILKEVEGL